MNKKQLLSIAMLISVVGINAHDLKKDPFPGLTRRIAANEAADKALFDARAAFDATLKGSGVAPSAGVNARTAQMAADARAAAIAEKATGNVDETGMFTNAWNGVKAFPGLAYTTVRTNSENVYKFAKENPTTSAIRGGAVLGAGYVVYRQAGNVWNKIKENPKTVAALVAAGALGYYKGDAALTAVKGLAGKLPEVSTPGFVNTGLGYVKGAGSTALDSVTSNPYTSAAYAAFGAQQVADYVGLAGSEEETATEIVPNQHAGLFVMENKAVVCTQELSQGDLAHKLQEFRAWSIEQGKNDIFIGIIDAAITQAS